MALLAQFKRFVAEGGDTTKFPETAKHVAHAICLQTAEEMARYKQGRNGSGSVRLAEGAAQPVGSLRVRGVRALSV